MSLRHLVILAFILKIKNCILSPTPLNQKYSIFPSDQKVAKAAFST